MLKASTDPFALREFLHTVSLEYRGRKTEQIFAALAAAEYRARNETDRGTHGETEDGHPPDRGNNLAGRPPASFPPDGLRVQATPIDWAGDTAETLGATIDDRHAEGISHNVAT